MAQKASGSQHGARHKIAKELRHKTTINDRLKSFEEGEKALIKIDATTTKGRAHSRYHGRTVNVTGTRGEAYEVKFKDGNKEKTLYIKPVHLQKVNQ